MKVKLTGQVDSKMRDYAKSYPGNIHYLREKVSCGCKGWSNLGTLVTTLDEKARQSLKLKTVLKIIFSFGIALAFMNVRLDREAAKTGVRVDSIYSFIPIADPVSARLEALFPGNASYRITGAKMGAAELVNFYRDQTRNPSGLYLRDIWNLSLEEKESIHDYIQWLFPILQPSMHNSKAPPLSPEIVREMRKDPVIIGNVRHSFNVMLEFYGFLYDQDSKMVIKNEDFDKRAAVWLLSPSGHHNFLRITRIITSLHLMGLHDEAQAFFNALERIAVNNQGIIPQNSLNFWREAAHSS